MHYVSSQITVIITKNCYVHTQEKYVWIEAVQQLLLQTLFIDFISFAVRNITFVFSNLPVIRRKHNFSRPFAVISPRLNISFSQ